MWVVFFFFLQTCTTCALTNLNDFKLIQKENLGKNLWWCLILGIRVSKSLSL